MEWFELKFEKSPIWIEVASFCTVWTAELELARLQIHTTIVPWLHVQACGLKTWDFHTGLNRCFDSVLGGSFEMITLEKDEFKFFSSWKTQESFATIWANLLRTKRDQDGCKTSSILQTLENHLECNSKSIPPLCMLQNVEHLVIQAKMSNEHPLEPTDFLSKPYC